MPSQTWIRATLALVAVLTAHAVAQDESSPAKRPAVIRGHSRLVPGAAIGRPVPMRQLETPRPFPNGYRSASVVPGDTSGDVRTIPTVPPPGTVIATSTRPIPTAQEEPLPLPEGIGEFATERRPSRVLQPVSKAEPPVPGNWKGNHPADGPPPPICEDPAVEVYGPAPRWYFSAEYLLWWAKGDRAPPLVTAGPIDPTLAFPGALNDPGTAILQDGLLNPGTRSGGRFTAGWFLDDCAGKAIEVSGFFLGSRSTTFDASSGQFPVLARPFLNVITGTEAVQIVSFPGLVNGRVSVNAPSQLWGLEANLICPACCGCDWRVNWLAGPRFLSLTEQLSVTEQLAFSPNADPARIQPFLPGDLGFLRDTFGTKNRFWGAQVGAETRWLRGRWTVDGRARVALGITEQELAINGFQLVNSGGTIRQDPGGLLALSSNSGTFRKSNFSVVPEVGMSVGYYATDWMRVSLGYNFLYWSSVVRPGDQVDRVLNPFLIPNFDTAGLVNNGVVRPGVPFKSTDYWAHGITVGLEFNF